MTTYRDYEEFDEAHDCMSHWRWITIAAVTLFAVSVGASGYYAASGDAKAALLSASVGLNAVFALVAIARHETQRRMEKRHEAFEAWQQQINKEVE